MKVGDKVAAAQSVVDCFITHLVWCYGGKSEFYPHHYNEIHFWLDHVLKKTIPEGVVVGFGSEEDKSPRFNVAVSFKHNNETVDLYIKEAELRRL